MILLFSWCVGCAIHTGYCNQLTEQHSNDMLALSNRISALERISKKGVRT